jgi:hypothetical protein
VLRLAGELGLLLDAGIDAAALLGNLGEITHALAGNEHGGARLFQRGVELRRPLVGRQLELVAHQPAQVGEHPGDAGIVELAGDGGIHRHLVVLQGEGGAVALPLLAHVAQRVFRTALVELVEHDELGVIDHVDFFELAGGAVFAGHHVDGKVDEVDDFRIALADAGGLDDDEVVRLALQEIDAVVQHDAGGRVLATRGHGAHVHARAAQRVHADTVAQQGTTRTATGGIDRQHRDAHLRKRVQKAQQQFVHHARLAGTAGAGEAEHGRLLAGQRPLLAQQREVGVGQLALLDGGEHVADGNFVVDIDLGYGSHFTLRALGGTGAGARHDVFDHLGEAELHAVIRVIDALDAVGLQLLDFFRRDGAAATAEHAHMAGAALAQHVDHVFEVFDVAALVGRQRDGVGVLLQRRAHHVFHRAVVAEVDHFGALRLDDAPHDVDGRVVAVEQAGRGDKAQRRGLGLRVAGGNVLGRRTHGATPTSND